MVVSKVCVRACWDLETLYRWVTATNFRSFELFFTSYTGPLQKLALSILAGTFLFIVRVGTWARMLGLFLTDSSG